MELKVLQVKSVKQLAKHEWYPEAITQLFQRIKNSEGDVTLDYDFFLLIANYLVNIYETEQFTLQFYKVGNKSEGKHCNKLIECNFYSDYYASIFSCCSRTQ